MSCIIGQTKLENNVTIEPMGCRPVSPDVCVNLGLWHQVKV